MQTRLKRDGDFDKKNSEGPSPQCEPRQPRMSNESQSFSL